MGYSTISGFQSVVPMRSEQNWGESSFQGRIFLFDVKTLTFFFQGIRGCKQREKAEVAAISAIFGCIVGRDNALSCGSEGLSRRVVFPLLNRRIRRGVKGKITDIEQLL